MTAAIDDASAAAAIAPAAGGATASELRGAVESFEDVFRAVLPRARRVAMRILANEAAAEDAAAEALARAHASWRKVASGGYSEAWILRVTANVALDMCRRHRRTLSVGLSVDAVDASHAGPDHTAAHDLAIALRRLPRRQREIVTLRYLEDFSEAEVADALGISVGTVKKESFRAREMLRKHLGTAFP